MPKLHRHRALPALVVAAAATLSGAAAFGQTTQPVTWVGPVAAPQNPGDYNTPEHWSHNQTPLNANREFLQINNGGTATVSGAASYEGTWLNLGLKTGDAGHLDVSGGTLTLGELRVGGRESLATDIADWGLGTAPNAGGTGSVLQTGGTVNINYSTGTEPPIQSLYVGDSGQAADNTAVGSYRITNGTLLSGIANDDAIVVGTGVGTQGTFIQEGGDVTSTGFIIIGRRGATGSWTISNGTLKSNSVSGTGFVIGDALNQAGNGLVPTSATLTQTGGDIDVAFQMEVGRRGATGVYNMSGGTLHTAQSLIVGAVASATFVTGTNGTLNLSGTGVITVGTNMNVGFGSATTATTGVGTVNMTGGTLQFNAANAILAVGNGRETSGTLDISGGSVFINGTAGNTSVIDVGRNFSSGLLRVRGTGSLNARQITVNTAIQSGSTPIDTTGRVRTVSFEGGTVDVGTITFGSGGTPATRALNISGGNVHIGFLTTGNPTGAGSSITTVSNNAAPVIDSLEVFTGSIFRATSDLTLTSTTTNAAQPGYRFGTATIDVTGATQLTINGPGNWGTGAARTLTKSGTGTLTLNLPQQYFAGSGITVSAGTLNSNTAIGGNLTINANSATNFGANAKLTALNVGAGATATVLDNGSANRVLDTANVTIDAAGRLDLKNNKMLTLVVPGTATGGVYNGLQGEVQRASNFGAWDQPGLTTSMPDAVAGLTTIGIATGAQVRGLGPTDTDTFAGQTITGATTIAMYTYAGDANLDGTIDGGDYGIIDNFAQVPGADGYANGDFNYDSVIDGGDYGIIDNNNQAQGAPFPTSGSAGLAGVTAVPEPSAVGVALFAAAGLFSRRRRHSNHIGSRLKA